MYYELRQTTNFKSTSKLNMMYNTYIINIEITQKKYGN